jgi:hypothetical protein
MSQPLELRLQINSSPPPRPVEATDTRYASGAELTVLGIEIARSLSGLVLCDAMQALKEAELTLLNAHRVNPNLINEFARARLHLAAESG